MKGAVSVLIDCINPNNDDHYENILYPLTTVHFSLMRGSKDSVLLFLRHLYVEQIQ